MEPSSPITPIRAILEAERKKLEGSRSIGYESAEGATWTCPQCGESPPPKYLSPINRHIRTSCACQRAVFAQRKKLEQEHMERAVRMERLRYCYAFLGREWTAESNAAYTLDTFERYRQPDAFRHVSDWMESPQGVLLLHGRYGTGKSHLMAAACNVLRDSGHKCRWVTAPKLFEAISQLRSAEMRPYDGTYRESWTDILRKLEHAEILFLDDVDKVGGTMFREEVYHSIIDTRIVGNKPIALTINDITRLGECMGESVADRLYVGRIEVSFKGDSYRKGLTLL